MPHSNVDTPRSSTANGAVVLVDCVMPTDDEGHNEVVTRPSKRVTPQRERKRKKAAPGAPKKLKPTKAVPPPPPERKKMMHMYTQPSEEGDDGPDPGEWNDSGPIAAFSAVSREFRALFAFHAIQVRPPEAAMLMDMGTMHAVMGDILGRIKAGDLHPVYEDLEAFQEVMSYVYINFGVVNANTRFWIMFDEDIPAPKPRARTSLPPKRRRFVTFKE